MPCEAVTEKRKHFLLKAGRRGLNKGNIGNHYLCSLFIFTSVALINIKECMNWYCFAYQAAR